MKGNKTMNKFYWRSAAFAIAACLSLQSCSKKTGTASEDSSSKPVAGGAVTVERTTQKAEEVLSDSYKATQLTIPEGIDYLSEFKYIPDKDKVIAVGSSTQSTKLLLFSSDFSSSSEIALKFPEEYTSSDEAYPLYSFSNSGEVSALLMLYDHGGITAPEEYDKNFNYEAYEAKTTKSYMFCRFSENGELADKISINGPGPDGIDDFHDEYGYLQVSSIYVTDDGGAILCLRDATILKINKDGSVKALYQYDDENTYIDGSQMVADKDGKLILAITSTDYTEDTPQVSQKFYDVNPETGVSAEPFAVSTTDYSPGGAITGGRGDYRLFIPLFDALYGVKADGSLESVLNWNDSDIGAITLYPVGENDFVAFGSDNYSNQNKFIYLRRRNMSELSDTVVLTLASLWGGGSDIVNQFNQSQNKYRIKIVDYSQYNSEEPPYTAEGAINQLKMDLISGKAPDIIITQNHNDITALSGKGAFVDLYQFMENDPDVNRDTLMPNLLKACENSNGQLYSLSPSFSIKTMAVKTKFTNKENWTLDEMISLYDLYYDPLDDDCHFYDGMSKEEMFRNLFYAATDLVDYESGVCRFDSPDFVKILKFCNRFVDEVYMPDKQNEPEAHQQYYTDKYYWWSNDGIIVSEIEAGGDSSLSYTKDVEAGEDITFVGYPSSDGSGGKLDLSENIAISATCPDKEGAWQFVRSYFTKEYQLAENDYGGKMNIQGLSARKDGFERDMYKTSHFTDENGESVEYYESKGDKYYPLTQEEEEKLTNYILGCDTIYGDYDLDVLNICLEEAAAYFAGETTAENAADMIQNRASIALSEKR